MDHLPDSPGTDVHAPSSAEEVSLARTLGTGDGELSQQQLGVVRTLLDDGEDQAITDEPGLGLRVLVPAAGDQRIKALIRARLFRSKGVPVKIGRYTILDRLGEGGMGVVYTAYDDRLDRKIAIKVLRSEAGGEDDVGKARLAREAQAMARLAHPGIVTVHEVGEVDGQVFVAMEFIRGQSLDRWLEDPHPWREVLDVFLQAGRGLEAAHRAGLVHRDFKPQNVLVGSEGGVKVLDFGLARSIGPDELRIREAPVPIGVAASKLLDANLTRTGALLGTPAYMAPEQHHGLPADARSDQFAFAVALFEGLHGQHPFDCSNLASLLTDAITGTVHEPPGASKVPPRLRRAVQRAMSVEPARRYPSMSELLVELGRDPAVQRRRIVAQAVALLAIVATLVLTGLWIRSLRIADEREALARDMGGSVREMELFLRAAHTLPLHDLERERDVLRVQLGEIEARTAAAGEIGVGPGNDALGRGHLALQDPVTAMQHFRRAEAAGYRAPGFDYSMGMALTELYRRELEKTTRIQSVSERQARTAEIEREVRAPALTHMRAALAQGVESPAYAFGLVAMYEGHHEEALVQARAAFAAAPWLYEAKKLEGDVLFALGSRTRADKNPFDYDRTMDYFGQAAAAYAAAADIARSDPAVHESACDLWIQAMNAAGEHGAPIRPAFEQARGACERAIVASPVSASGHVKLAFAHQGFAFSLVNGTHDGESPEQALAQAVERVEAAARLSPGDAFASYLVGAVWRGRGTFMVNAGRDGRPALERGIAGYEAALALDPTFLWALNEQGAAFSLRGVLEARRGIDPQASFDQALARCRRALELDPDFLYPQLTIVNVHIRDAQRLAAAERSPAAAIELGLAAVAVAEARDPDWQWIPFWRTQLHRAAAEYAIANGDDPSAALASGEASAAQFVANRKSFPDADADHAVGDIAVLTAEALLARIHQEGPSPATTADLDAALSRARTAFARARADTPWELNYAVGLARVELVELRLRLLQGRATQAQADAALAPLEAFLPQGAEVAEPRVDPRIYGTAARVHEARAALREQLGQDPTIELTAGILRAEQAIAVGPGHASGQATLGRLRLLRARAVRRGR